MTWINRGNETPQGRPVPAVEGVIESAGDSERYSSVQRTIMADAVTLHYPAISAVLSGTERHRLDEALKRMKQARPAAP